MASSTASTAEDRLRRHLSNFFEGWELEHLVLCDECEFEHHVDYDDCSIEVERCDVHKAHDEMEIALLKRAQRIRHHLSGSGV